MNMDTQPRIYKSLLKSELIVQSRRLSILSIVVLIAIILLFAWKSLTDKFGLNAPYILLSASISFVLVNIGLLAYPSALTLDRDRGVFEKLRTTPATTTAIMISRLVVQMIVAVCVMAIVLVVAHFTNHITLPTKSYPLTAAASIVGVCVYLTAGQFLAACIRSANTLNAVGRALFMLLTVFGALASFNLFGAVIKHIIDWSPYGVVNTVLTAAMHPVAISEHVVVALIAAVGYILVFGILGIRYFKW